MKDLFIPVLLGTNREGRYTDKVARLIIEQLEKRANIGTRLFDPRDFDFPPEDYGLNLKDRFPEYKQAVIEADGFIIVTPEYNHSIPGVLKSMLDIMLSEYRRKAVAVAGTSGGPWGGVRVIQNVQPILRELGLVMTDRALNFTNVRDSWNDDGTHKDEKMYERADKFIDDLIWMAKALKWGRENLD